MGYRSRVDIYIRQDEEDLKKIIDSAKIIDKYFRDDDYKITKNSDGESVLHIYFDSIKWYDEYPLISFLKQVMNNLNDEDYLFGRTGEEWDDIEIKGEYGYAYVSTSLDFDVDC